MPFNGKDKLHDGDQLETFHSIERIKTILHELENTRSVEQIVSSHDKKSKHRPCVTINTVTCDESPFLPRCWEQEKQSDYLTCNAIQVLVCGFSLRRSKKKNKRSLFWSSVCIELEANKKKKSLIDGMATRKRRLFRAAHACLRFVRSGGAEAPLVSFWLKVETTMRRVKLK